MSNKLVDKGSNVIVGIIFLAVFLAVMLLALVLIINGIITANQGLNSNTLSGNAVNETHYMNGTIGYFDLTNYNLPDVSCTIGTNGIVNASNGIVITHGNWTQPNCRVVIATNSFNNTNWNVTYSYTYDSVNQNITQTGLKGIQNSLISMTINFFALAPTIGTILAVILLIAGIVILVHYVRKMKDKDEDGEYYG